MNYFWNHWASDALVRTLGWTLLHSLWQGAVIALLLAIGLVLLRKNSSKIRYFVATTALTAFLLSSIITFSILYEPNTSFSGQNTTLAADTPTTIFVKSGQTISAKTTFLQNYQGWFQDYFAQHLPLLVIIWALGVMTLLLHFLGGFAYTQRLKHYKVQKPSKIWQIRTQELAKQLGIRKSVKVLESALAQTPMVIGFFKPVILIPLGAFAGLSPKQVESILAHELAHIQRNDYLINILQSLVEILFFYHPATWWISARIREERENCCDDIAVELVGDQLTLAKTITTLAEMQLQNPLLAMAFLGDRNTLTSRVKRLLQAQQRKATFAEGFLAAVLVMTLLVVVALPAKAYWSNIDGIKPLVEFISEKTNIISAKEPTTQKEAEPKITTQEKTIQPNDTIRFGEGFMLVTHWDGSVEVFKDGILLKEEEYEQYTNEFAITNDKVRIGKAESPIAQISLDKPQARTFAFTSDDNMFSIVIPEGNSWQTMPKAPIPPIPPLPKISVGVPMFSGYSPEYGNYSVFFRDKKIETLIVDGKEVKPSKLSQYPDIEARVREFQANQPEMAWEAFEQEMELYGEEMAKWGENFAMVWVGEDKKLQEETKRLEIETQRLEFETKKMEEGLQKILAEMEKDGLIQNKDSKNLKISIEKGVMRINDNEIPADLQEKYQQLFEQYLNMKIDGKGVFQWQQGE